VTGNTGSNDGAGSSSAGSSDEAARRAREDAEWQSIVQNYGDRPEFTPPTPAEDPEPDPPVADELPAELGPRAWEPAPEDDRYVPPPPPPLPRPRGLRLAAWLGLFGVPAVVLLCIVLNVSLPSPLGFLALVWFVGGFGYLVATMNGPRDSDGGWDDGAVV
jgi:hypothetical protein